MCIRDSHNAAQARIILLFHDLVAAREFLHPLRAGGEGLAADAVPGEGVARLREGVPHAPHIGRPRFLVLGLRHALLRREPAALEQRLRQPAHDVPYPRRIEEYPIQMRRGVAQMCIRDSGKTPASFAIRKRLS